MTNQSVTIANPGYVGIAKGNKQPDAAWEWLKFLVSAEALIIRSKVQQGGCPSRKSAPRDTSYANAAVRAEQAVPAAMESAKREIEDVLRRMPQPAA